ncbi:MAG: hypothetical protein NTZ01_04550, partial [Verrucomicrobia bacterium]|nr:hypothetical protein [Verrucomicrobiota bacterium]
MKPNLYTFFFRGLSQVRQHGVSLLYLRYWKRREILHTPPIQCDPQATLEIHTQICARDWLNSIWSLKSFHFFVPNPFRLVIFCDVSITPHMAATLESHFPGAIVMPCHTPSAIVSEVFAKQFPRLYGLRTDGRFNLLPKIVDSYALRRNAVVLAIDPDVLFFDQPMDLLSDLDANRGYFARLNVPSCDCPPRWSFCIDADLLRERVGLEFPIRFQAGLGSMNYSECDWELIERIVSEIPFDPNRAFLAEQTLVAILSVAGGYKTLPPERYAILPVANLDGVVARHYYSHTRDLL